ncbi:HD-GYP domain-containing protein [bacterium]|nr:HD-GYP domain-containing protein [bacterium]
MASDKKNERDHIEPGDVWVEIETSFLGVGQSLACDLYVGDIILLKKGQTITEALIKAFEKRNISSVRVKKSVADDLQVESGRLSEISDSIPSVHVEVYQEILANEEELWDEAGIETQVDEKLLNETSKCVEDVFTRFSEGAPLAVEKVKDYVKDIIKQAIANPDNAVKLLDVEHHDKYTFRHSVNVGLIFLAIVRETAPDEKIESLTTGAVFHDVGKTKIPLKIIQKPGPLTAGEFEIMKEHPTIGVDILTEHGGFDDDALDICKHHHEKWDGTGYPDGLKGEEISEYAQLSAVADVYDAITTSRSYRKKMDFGTAMNLIIKGSGKHFSPKSANRLWSTLGLYPVGSFVKLSTGEIGVVRNINHEIITRPVVMVMYDGDMRRRRMPRLINLYKELDISIVGGLGRRNLANA